jgi:hypothetical protein
MFAALSLKIPKVRKNLNNFIALAPVTYLSD